MFGVGIGHPLRTRQVAEVADALSCLRGEDADRLHTLRLLCSDVINVELNVFYRKHMFKVSPCASAHVGGTCAAWQASLYLGRGWIWRGMGFGSSVNGSSVQQRSASFCVALAQVPEAELLRRQRIAHKMLNDELVAVLSSTERLQRLEVVSFGWTKLRVVSFSQVRRDDSGPAKRHLSSKTKGWGSGRLGMIEGLC